MHRPGLFFHVDISGLFQVQSYGGHYYFITYKDDHSNYRFAFFMKDKKAVFSMFQTFYKLTKKEAGRSMVKLRIDNGRECLVPLHEECPKHHGHKGNPK
jgi:hypothetical protein